MTKILKCVDCDKIIENEEEAKYCSECGAIMCKECRNKFLECEACYDADYCGM